MKVKTSILLTVSCAFALNAFGQKPAVKTVTETKTVTTTTTAKTPTVKEILEKYEQAIGGKKANEKIKSRVAKGTIELMPMGIKGTFESYSAAPNKSLSVATVAGIGELLEGFDGTTAWSVNPIQGNRVKQGDELAQTKLNSVFDRDTNLAKLYSKMEFKGVEKVGDGDAYVLIAMPQNLPSEVFYFDTKSGLLVRLDTTTVTPEGKTPGKTFLEDYREVDGVKVPFKTRSVTPQAEIVVTFSEVKNNVPIDAAKFVRPKS